MHHMPPSALWPCRKKAQKMPREFIKAIQFPALVIVLGLSAMGMIHSFAKATATSSTILHDRQIRNTSADETTPDAVIHALTEAHVPGGLAAFDYCGRAFQTHSVRPVQNSLRASLDAIVRSEERR